MPLLIDLVKVKLLVAQSCLTQAALSMGFSRQEYWSGSPFPSPGDLPNKQNRMMSGYVGAMKKQQWDKEG